MIKKHKHEVWAKITLSESDCDAVRTFFTEVCGIEPRYVIRHMHLTVYHARRLLPGLEAGSEQIRITVPTRDTRFMVMAPGGENRRADLDPTRHKVGVRVHRLSRARTDIQSLRLRLAQLEARYVLGSRAPTSASRNAFGARNFQPHVTLLRPGHGVGPDLNPVGKLFRDSIAELTFDSLVVSVVETSHEGPSR